MRRWFVRSLVFASLLALPCAASAQVALVPIQGVLTDLSGVPVEGTVSATLRLYTAATGGTAFWEAPSVTLSLVEGRFTYHLGDEIPLDLTHFNGQRVYLGVSISTQPEMFPRVELATAPYAAYAARAGSVPWAAITGVPSGLNDGDDDTNTTYTGTSPIALVGTSFGLSSSGCVAGETWVYSGSGWACEPAGANYVFSGGLTNTAGTVTVDTDAIQARIGATCAAGSSIRAISSTGAVTCESDDGGISYLPGTGLTLSGATFAVNPTEVQTRLNQTCAAGSSIRAIAENGNVTCESDDGAAYFAGTGLSLSGTTFTVNSAEVQTRVSGTCDPGSAIRTISSTGAVTCQTNTVDTNTTYTAGTGLALTGTAFSVDSTIQRRVSGFCTGNNYIQSISDTGTVTCGTFVDTNTTYTAGTGLTLTGTVFTPNFTVTQRRVTGTCAGTEYVRSITEAGGVTCATPTDTNSGGDITEVNAGSGLTGGSTTGPATLSVNFGAVQARLASSCPAGQAVQGVDAAGNVTCTSRLRNAAFEMLQRSEHMMTGGGTITFSANSRLAWTGRIINIGSLHNSWNGTMHQNIEMPAVGTTIAGLNGTASVVVQSDGVPIPDWHGLYYRTSEGDGSQASDSSRFHIMAYNLQAGTAGEVGAEYMLVAFKNGDTHSGRVYVNTEGGITLARGDVYDGRFGDSLVRQITDSGGLTYRDYSVAPFHMRLTAAGSRGFSRPIPHDILLELCADEEGCSFQIAMHRWDGGNEWGASIHSRFYYSPTFIGGLGHYWRTSDTYGGAQGWDGSQDTAHLSNAGGWGACYLTDGNYASFTHQGDLGVGLNFLFWNGYDRPTRICDLTIWD